MTIEKLKINNNKNKNMLNSATSPNHVKNTVLMKNVLALRMRYKTYDEIGKILKISPTRAYRLVVKALQYSPKEDAEKLKEISSATYKDLIAACREKAMNGDKSQQDTLIKALDKLNDLMGLNIAKQQIEMNKVDTVVGDNLSLEVLDLSIETKREILEAVKKYNEKIQKEKEEQEKNKPSQENNEDEDDFDDIEDDILNIL